MSAEPSEARLDRRYPLRPFDPRLMEGVLHGRSVRSVEVFPEGKGSGSYRVTLSDGETCVLRLLSGPTAARECYTLRLASSFAPVPTVLDAGEDWLVLSFVAGRSLAKAPEGLGAAAAALPGLALCRFEQAGWIEADGRICPFDFGHEGGFVGAILTRPTVLRWTGLAMAEAISRILARPAVRFDATPGEVCLCHGDFNPSNILLHEGAVSGILDWEFAHAGDRYMDLGNLLRRAPRDRHDEIRAGYESRGERLPDNWVERAECADVSSHLEFLTSGLSDGFKQECVGWLRSFVERYGDR